jgi:tetraacyldisaccharide 4'-kinase
MIKPGHHNWKVIFIPFSWLYGLVVWIRNTLYDTGLFSSTGFNIPIISVGNIHVGGTGKTPHVEYLAEMLSPRFNIATLSRGYKRKTSGFRIASEESTPREVGDEPLQVKRRFPGITVAVDRKRINGIELLMKQVPPVDIILLDDAYQHRAVKPGFSILLVDYGRPLESDRLLPAGMLREPASNRNRANIILVTRSPETLKPVEMSEYVNRLGLSSDQHLYFTAMKYGELLPVFQGAPERDVSWFKNNVGAVLIVAGIANPHPLKQYARSINHNIFELFFPDHHSFSQRDMVNIFRRYRDLKKVHNEILVLTTEKDAARLLDHEPEPALRNALFSVRIHVHFLNDDKDEFDRQILNYVNSNKRSSILYQGKDS